MKRRYEVSQHVLMAPLMGFPDIDLVKRAYSFADHAHWSAVEGSGGPFFNHPLRVAMILVEEAQIRDPEVVAAALLHDTLVQPTPVSSEDLIRLFGMGIASIVRALTPDAPSPGTDVDLAEQAYLKNLTNAPASILRIKIAERLDILRHIDGALEPNSRVQFFHNTRRYFLQWARSHMEPLYAEMRQRAGGDPTARMPVV